MEKSWKNHGHPLFVKKSNNGCPVLLLFFLTVTSPDVPGLVTEGRTAAEIQANVQEALEALFEAWAELKQTPPPALRPLSLEQSQRIEMLVTA